MPRQHRERAGRQRPAFSPPGELLTLQELQNQLRRSLQANPGIDPLAMAFALADVGTTVEDNSIATPGNRPVFTIVTALFAALREVQRPYPYVSTESAPFVTQPHAAGILLSRADGVFSDEYLSVYRAGERADPVERTRELRLNMIWTLAENGIFQGEMIARFGSALVLTGLAGFRGLPASPDLTNALFRSHIGLTAYDYVLILFALWALSLKQPLVTLSTLIELGPRHEELTRAAGRVVSALARRADRFRDLSDAPQFLAYSGKALPSATFQRWPFVQLNDDQFVVPAHPFLKVQLTSKFLTKALAFARQDARPEEKGRTAYSAFVGQERFEPFVRELCDLWCPGNHFDEYEYARGRQSADRIAFESHGRDEVAILLQLKAKLVLEATHFGAEAEALARDLGSALSETVYKSVQFLTSLQRAHDAGHLNRESEALSQRILASRHLCLVGIVPEIPALFTMSDVRQLLWAEVTRHLDEHEQQWLDRNAQRIKWHVLGLDEFVLFLGLPRTDRHFYKRLSGYFRDAGPDRLFIDQQGRFPVSFRNYLATKYRGRLDSARVGLQDVVDTVVEDAKRYFRQPRDVPGDHFVEATE